MTANDERSGVVLSGAGGVWRVRTDDDETVEASMRGRLKKSNSGKRPDGSHRRDTVSAAASVLKLAVGDDVRLEPGERGSGWTIAARTRTILTTTIRPMKIMVRCFSLKRWRKKAQRRKRR